jgi:hypothetical protein
VIAARAGIHGDPPSAPAPASIAPLWPAPLWPAL